MFSPAALLLVVISSSGAVGDPRLGGNFGNLGGSAEPRLFAPFNANISANIQNGKNALGSPQNSLTFLINVLIAVGDGRGCVGPSSMSCHRSWLRVSLLRFTDFGRRDISQPM